MKIQLYKCITGARVAGLLRVYSANKSCHVILIVSQNSASMCQHAQLYNYAIFRELHAIMFLSLSGVSITFANLYILFHAVFIGCPWAWETLGGRYLNLPALCQSYSPQLHTKSKCKFETLFMCRLSDCFWRVCIPSGLTKKLPSEYTCTCMFSFCFTLIFALQGYTPLHIAALHGHRHILDLLVGTYGKKWFCLTYWCHKKCFVNFRH